MAQFPMGRNTGRNFPVRSTELDDLLISLLEQQQMTTPEENMRQRLESLRRADAGTSPLRMSLYDELSKTGPQQIPGPSTDAAGYGLPASVANSAFSGSTGYAKQGPPTPVGLESRSPSRDQFGYGIPASVANSIGQSQSPFFQQPSENQNKRAVAAVESAMRAGDYEPYGPTRPQVAGAMFPVGRDVDIVGNTPDERDLPADVDMGSGSTEDPTPPERTLLERLGRAIRNNQELAAMGAQLAGGLISNAAQNRAQRRADRTNQQRTARSNLISALTGGRVRPDVERAQADTGGILSLNTLGQAIRGGGAMVQGELARQVEEAERERKAKLEERGMKASELGAKSLDTYRKAMVDLNKRQLDADIKEAAAQLAFDYLKEVRESKEGRDLSEKKITEFSSTLATLEKLDNLEDFIMSSDLSFLEMGPLSLEKPSQFIFGSDAKVAEAKIQGLIGEVARTIPGVLTEPDQRRLESRLVSLNNTKATAADIADSFREELTIKLQKDLSGFAASKFNVDYFQNELDKYLEGRGAQGFESMLTKDEIVLGR